MSTSPDVVTRNLLEAEAKIAYEVFAHRTGATTPWEHLSLNEWQAWKEVVQTMDDLEQDGPECECGLSLVCPKCDSPPTCSECDTDLSCAHCAKPKCPECDTNWPVTSATTSRPN